MYSISKKSPDPKRVLCLDFPGNEVTAISTSPNKEAAAKEMGADK